MRARDRARHLVWIALLALTCAEGSLPSPTVRVDLRHELPRKVLRRLLAHDSSFECRRKVALAKGGVRQRFVITWRVFEMEPGSRHITMVQVEPDGPFEGARMPSASAMIEGKGQRRVVQLEWKAQKGCRSVSARKRVPLGTTDPGCKVPKARLKIFGPDKPAE